MTELRTKLVCTLGPASASPKMVRGMASAGVTIFRLNASHGTEQDHARAVEIVRDAEDAVGRTLAILGDLPGPKVRLGTLSPNPFRFQPGRAFRLRAEGEGDEEGAATTYPELAYDLREGDRILLADGAVELVVTAIEGADVVAECVQGGTAYSGQGINVPAERLGLPAVTDRDRRALATMLELGVDLVAQSFVREASDIEELRDAMGERALPIVAKIETKPAVERIDRILEVADGLMVARGDLGVELPMEEIPLLQKDLLRAARRAGRPCIVATQMLESMIRAPRPTRAEATDVANAVLDGADAIMLSGETAIGDHPFVATSAAIRIARTAEQRGAAYRAREPACTHSSIGAAVAHAAAAIAEDAPNVVAITCYTETGRTARLLAAERPGVPIFAFIPNPNVRRACELLWGVRPLPAEPPADTDEMISLMDLGLRDRGLAHDGDHVVMAAASPAGKTTTNMVKVHVAGSPIR